MSKDELSSSVSVSRIIPKEESSDFQTWSIPEVKSQADEELDDLANVPMLTAEQLEEIHQQAYQEGFQEGQKNGYDEGFAKGVEEGKLAGHKQAMDSSLEAIQQQTFHFEQLFKSFQDPFSQMSEQVEHEIVSLAMSIARQIIRQEINTQPETIIPLVKKTLHLLPSHAKRIKIFLNPSDLALVKGAFELNDDIDTDSYRLYDDINIKRGGCIVDTDISHIDATIDKRISDIAKSLIPPAPELSAKQQEHFNEGDDIVDSNVELVDKDKSSNHTQTSDDNQQLTNNHIDSEMDLEPQSEPPIQ